ncbi:MAG: hypothetical protein ABII72_01100 [Parcubacteria group bacterium]
MEKDKLINLIKQSKLPRDLVNNFVDQVEEKGVSTETIRMIIQDIEEKRLQIRKERELEKFKAQELVKIVAGKKAQLEQEFSDKISELESELDQNYQEAIRLTEEDQQQVIKNSLAD